MNTTDLSERLPRLLDELAQSTPIDATDEFPRQFDRSQFSGPASKRPAHRISLVLAVAAAVVALVVAGIVRLPKESPNAFASWTPVPRAVTPAEMGPIVDACNASSNGDPDSGVAPNPFDAGSAAEIRGEFAMLFETQAEADGPFVQCIAVKQPEGWFVFASGSPTASLTDGLPVRGGGGGSEAFAWDVAGYNPAAAHVDVIVPEVGNVTATVSDGFYFAWWPDELEDGDAPKPPEYQVRFSDSNGNIIGTINQ